MSSLLLSRFLKHKTRRNAKEIQAAMRSEVMMNAEQTFPFPYRAANARA